MRFPIPQANFTPYIPLSDQPPPVFPTHDAPLKTNLGINYLAGELRVENGCLKLYRLGWDNPNRTVGDQLRDIWLPVWPPDFELRMDGGQGQVLDPEGRVAAEVGETVQLSGPSRWPESARDSLRASVPQACRLPLWTVGDEVSVIAEDEPTIVPLPGSVLHFPRSKTWGHPISQWLAPPPEDQTLTLNGRCLRAGSGGPVVVWSPGFYPDRVDGRVVVRNGGGRTVAVTGQAMSLDSGAYFPDDPSSPCRGKRWVGTVLLELPEAD